MVVRVVKQFVPNATVMLYVSQDVVLPCQHRVNHKHQELSDHEKASSGKVTIQHRTEANCIRCNMSCGRLPSKVGLYDA